MQPKVSILIPCYNVEKYLPQCLESVIGQTLRDIEIICINDGSTDSTLDILKQYADKDTRIKIIDKENEGYGISMNCGIDMATGEYIGIVESDDWVDADAFETLYNAAKKYDVDMVKGDFVFFDDDTGIETPSWGVGIVPTLFNRVFCPATDAPWIIWSGHPSIWTCLYRTKMIRDYKIYFSSTPGASFQDMGFKPKTFLAAKKFIYIDKPVLHYRKHANNSDKNNKNPFAICDVHNDTDAWAKQNLKGAGKYVKILNQCRFANYLWNLRRLSGDVRREFRKRFAKDFYHKIGAKEVEYKYMDTRQKLKLKHIVFHNMFSLILYLTNLVCAPVYRTRLRNGEPVHYVFHKIPMYKRKSSKKEILS